jgi:hypothetical protein
MAISEVFYSDFYCNKGDPKDLLESSGYKERKKLFEGLNRELDEEEKLLTTKEKKPKKQKIASNLSKSGDLPKEKKAKKSKNTKNSSNETSMLPILGPDMLNLPFLQNFIKNYNSMGSIIYGVNPSGDRQEMMDVYEGDPKKKIKKNNEPQIIEIIENEDEK